jgi:hypothetical protein
MTAETKHSDEDKEKILQDFSKKLIENQIDMPLEFEKIFREHFWELLA